MEPIYFSRVVKDADGAQLVWEFSFSAGYLDRAHVKVEVFNYTTGETVQTPFTWVGPNTVSISPVVAAGRRVTIYRDTPKDKTLVNYSAGSLITAANLDRANLQSLFLAQEAWDRATDTYRTLDEAVQQAVLAARNAETAALLAAGASETAIIAAVEAAESARRAQELVGSIAPGIEPGVIDEPAAWETPVPSVGSPNGAGPLNAQAKAITAKMNSLKELVGPSIEDVGIDGNPGGTLSVPPGVHVVPARPVRALNGPGEVKWGKISAIADDLDYPYPLYRSNLCAIDVTVGEHRGLNAHLFTRKASGQITAVYRTSKWHGVTPSSFVSKTSYSLGTSWGPRSTVYHRDGTDSRCSVSYDGGDTQPWVILLATRTPGDAVYQDAKALVSIDFGVNWTVYNIPNPNNEAINFHGNIKLMNGHLVGYSYPNDRKVDAFRAPLSDLSNWTWHRGVIAPAAGQEAMSETTVVTVGTTHLAFIRSSGAECRIAKSTDPDGLVWGEPVRTNITMGTNPYSGIEAPEQGKAWILFTDRKADVNDAYDRNGVFSLEVDQNFIDSNYTDWSFRPIMQTPHYSVGHVFGTRLPDGRFVAAVNCGETDGSGAGLYMLTPAKGEHVSAMQIAEMIPRPNLLINGNFQLNRIYPANTPVTANMRNRYFADGWTFIHGNTFTVTFANVATHKNAWNEAAPLSPRYMTAKITFAPVGATLQLTNRMPLGHVGFRNVVTVRYKARYRAMSADATPPRTIPSIIRAMPSQANEVTTFGTAVPMKTYWQEFVFTKYVLYNTPPLPADAVGGYDALILNFSSQGAEPGVDIDVADVKMEIGNTASPIIVDYASELRVANQYYWRTDDNGTIRSQNGTEFVEGTASGYAHRTLRFPTTMWKVPTVNTYNPESGDSAQARNYTTGAVSATAIVNTSTNAVTVRATGAAGELLGYHVIANAQP